MNMYYLDPSVILKDLRKFEVDIDLEDPITKQTFRANYDDIHAMLVVDSKNLVFEGQIISAMYAEMSRLTNSAMWMSVKSDMEYVRWKAHMARECASKTPEKLIASGKPAANQGPTGTEVETYYRSHKDYEDYSMAGKRYLMIANIFKDAARAFDMKSRTLSDQTKVMAGYERTTTNEYNATERAERGDALKYRLSDYVQQAADITALATSLADVELPAPTKKKRTAKK